MPKRSARAAAPVPPSIVVGFDAAVPLDTLQPHPMNPREGDVGAISTSMQHNGIFQALVVQRSTRTILSGHHRTMAARALGRTDLPVLWVECDDERALSILLADNRSSDLAHNDDAKLLEGLKQLANVHAALYNAADMDALRAGLAEPVYGTALPDDVDDTVPPVPEAPFTQPGDVITLGRHRLLCADARDPDAYRVLCAGDDRAPDLLFTDPPYGLDVVGGAREIVNPAERQARGGKTIANDALAPDALATFWRTAFDAMLDAIRPGAAVYVCSPPGAMSALFGAPMAARDAWRHILVWVKSTFVLGHSDYHYRHELILYGWKPGAGHYFTDDRTQDSVWEFPRPPRSADHPTMKPLALVVKAIENSSTNGQRVLDPFCGSGTTVLACEATGRTARAIELDPAYCDVIARRYEAATGEPAQWMRAGQVVTPPPA